MAIAWFQTDEVQRILKALKPQDLGIRMEPSIVGPNRLIWTLPEKVEHIFDRSIDKAVKDEVGYSFADREGKDRDRWIEVYEQQATIQMALVPFFGDPNILLGHGLEKAQEIHRKDPGRIKREWDEMTGSVA